MKNQSIGQSADAQAKVSNKNVFVDQMTRIDEATD